MHIAKLYENQDIKTFFVSVFIELQGSLQQRAWHPTQFSVFSTVFGKAWGWRWQRESLRRPKHSLR